MLVDADYVMLLIKQVINVVVIIIIIIIIIITFETDPRIYSE